MHYREACVVNIFGGRGTGKTTLTAGLFYHMKSLGHSVFMALDVIPGITETDKGMYLSFGITPRVMQYEAAALTSDYIITNNPLPMSLLAPGRPESFRTYVLDAFNSFRNINVFIKGIEELSVTNGENEVLSMMKESGIPFIEHERIDSGYGGIIDLYDSINKCREKIYGETDSVLWTAESLQKRLTDFELAEIEGSIG